MAAHATVNRKSLRKIAAEAKIAPQNLSGWLKGRALLGQDALARLFAIVHVRSDALLLPGGVYDWAWRPEVEPATIALALLMRTDDEPLEIFLILDEREDDKRAESIYAIRSTRYRIRLIRNRPLAGDTLLDPKILGGAPWKEEELRKITVDPKAYAAWVGDGEISRRFFDSCVDARPPRFEWEDVIKMLRDQRRLNAGDALEYIKDLERTAAKYGAEQAKAKVLARAATAKSVRHVSNAKKK